MKKIYMNGVHTVWFNYGGNQYTCMAEKYVDAWNEAMSTAKSLNINIADLIKPKTHEIDYKFIDNMGNETDLNPIMHGETDDPLDAAYAAYIHDAILHNDEELVTLEDYDS